MDLIIPVYNSKTIDETLASIAYQTNRDVNVYIIDDCSDVDYTDTINFYRNFLNITYYRMDRNLGPGRARQTGIDISNSSYILFMDSDDSFASPDTLEFFNCYTNNKYDLVISNFIEEAGNSIIEHNKDEIWMHGKLYSRSFLEKNKIHFNETRANEDNFFNHSILLHDPRVCYVDAVTYIYRNNCDSITRANDYEYLYSGNAAFAYNISEAMREAMLDGCSREKIASLGFRTLLSMYGIINKWADRDITDMINNTKKIFRLTDLSALPNDYKNNFINSYFDNMQKDNPNLYNSLTIPFDEYFRMIGDEND